MHTHTLTLFLSLSLSLSALLVTSLPVLSLCVLLSLFSFCFLCFFSPPVLLLHHSVSPLLFFLSFFLSFSVSIPLSLCGEGGVVGPVPACALSNALSWSSGQRLPGHCQDSGHKHATSPPNPESSFFGLHVVNQGEGGTATALRPAVCVCVALCSI